MRVTMPRIPMQLYRWQMGTSVELLPDMIHCCEDVLVTVFTTKSIATDLRCVKMRPKVRSGGSESFDRIEGGRSWK